MGLCLRFLANGLHVREDGSISSAGAKSPFQWMMREIWSFIFFFPFSFFCFYCLASVSVLFCCRQLSALKRAKLHVLARMSAADSVSLFTHFLFPVDISLCGNSCLLCLSSPPCVSTGLSPVDRSPVFAALSLLELYKGCKYLARYERENTKLQSSNLQQSSWPHTAGLSDWSGPVRRDFSSFLMLVSFFPVMVAVKHKTPHEQWGSRSKQQAVRVWQPTPELTDSISRSSLTAELDTNEDLGTDGNFNRIYLFEKKKKHWDYVIAINETQLIGQQNQTGRRMSGRTVNGDRTTSDNLTEGWVSRLPLYTGESNQEDQERR